MPVTNTDLLMIQRGNVPYAETVENLATKINSDITPGTDIPVASASQLGVIRVGNNLSIDGSGILSAVVPGGLDYQGTWTDPFTVPTDPLNGYFWVWQGGNGVSLNSTSWGPANGTVMNDGDRIFYDGTSFEVVPGAGGSGGVETITGTTPIVITDTDSANPNVSITAATTSAAGSLSASDKLKLDSVEQGAQVNVNPTQSYASASTTGQLTLSPGGNATTLPQATGSAAGLMSANDKTTLDSLVANPGGVVSIVAGDGIIVNTASAPGSAGTPEINVAFGDTPNGTPTQVMPFDITVLSYLP